MLPLRIVEATPAWTSNCLKRLVFSARRYVVDSAFVGAILRVDSNTIRPRAYELGERIIAAPISTLWV